MSEKLTVTTRAPGRLREDSYELSLEISGGGTITPKALVQPLGGIVQRALYKAQDDLVQAITLQARMNDPVAQLDGKAQRLALLDTLPATLEFTLDAIPNGYSTQELYGFYTGKGSITTCALAMLGQSYSPSLVMRCSLNTREQRTF